MADHGGIWKEMKVFYRGEFAIITDQVYESFSPVHQWFRLNELQTIHIVLGKSDSLSPALIGAAAPIAVVTWQVSGSGMVAAMALGVLAVSSGLSRGCLRGREHPHELRALHQGKMVCLLRTTDTRTLGQIRRALIRAIEG
ncbi:DUF6232 family protein [Catelliglobosispora koreensis]|uniref:DUF6232 family protein n=1 Tax=Catelliglobosispora koreensis TaxID=129052 RepID=UPI0012F98BA7|nr:DUF6232 family protein [Catelliglobosispora koreensis]